jgi:hypothetical protein
VFDESHGRVATFDGEYRRNPHPRSARRDRATAEDGLTGGDYWQQDENVHGARSPARRSEAERAALHALSDHGPHVPDAPDLANETDRRRSDRGRGATPRGANPSTDKNGYLLLTPASTVKIDRPRWAWDRRIPIAGVTLVAGREGQGKTAFVFSLAAQLTRGTLDGDLQGEPGTVVYVGIEDDPSTVLVPRLMAAEADLDRFRFLQIKGGGAFSISIDCGALAARLAELNNVAAVIIDPLDAHLGTSIDTHKKAEVQRTIAMLNELAQQHRCAVIGIAHLSKRDSTDMLLKVVGSIGFTTSARSVLAIGPNPNDPTERVCALAKANMTARDEVDAVRFRLEEAFVEHPDGGEPIPTVRVVVSGALPGFDADSILAVPGVAKRSAVTEAAEWLEELLANEGPMFSEEIKRLARDDIAERTLNRAAKRLRVVMERDNSAQGRPTTWRLPRQDPRGPTWHETPEPCDSSESGVRATLTDTDAGTKELADLDPGVYLQNLAEQGVPWSQ